MFEIYSIGDSEFLEYVLNAVAMICGTSDFVKLVSIGLVFGIIIVCVQSILVGVKELNFQQILVGWLMYACFFGYPVTVTIEDAYTGQVRVVDNVPIGVGFAGGMISNIGYGITELFEQAYSPVASVIGQPFAEPLRLITALRAGAADGEVINVINQQLQDGDIGKSLNNYIRECTMMKVAVGQARLEDIYNQDWNVALPFNNDVYGTQIIVNGAAVNTTCRAGWTQINQQLTQAFNNQQVIRKINEVMGAMDSNGISSTTDPYNTALLMLGKAQTGAQDFIKTAFLEPIYIRAAQGYYKDFQDINGALMINQAISQRNTQWAAEQSLFMTVVRPMMTFFEGFIYAITPLMGFLFVLGTFGQRLAIRYFQTVLWIQLWMPVLSICNLYIVLAANGQISTIGDLTSFYAIDEASKRLENWLATGGMLAASTPIISLFLVTGSTYAFTTLASRLGGGDHINEKIPSNDAVQPGAYYQREAFSHGNSKVEAMATGAENAFKQINMGDAFNATLSSARSTAQAEAGTFAKMYTQMDSRGLNQSQNAKFERALGRDLLAEHNTQAQMIEQHLKQTGQTEGLSREAIEQKVGEIYLAAAGGLSGNLGIGNTQSESTSIDKTTGDISHPNTSTTNSNAKSKALQFGFGGSLSGDTGAKGSTRSTSSEGTASKEELSRSHGLAFSAADTSAMRDTLASKFNEGYTQSWAKSLDKKESGGLSEQFTRAQTASETFSELNSHSAEFSATKSQSSIEAAAQILGTEGGREAIAAKFNEIRGTALGHAVQDRYDKLSRYANTGGTQETRTAALLEVLAENGDLKGISEVSSVTGKPSLDYDGSTRYAGLSGPSDNVRTVSEKIDETAHARSMAALEGQVNSGDEAVGKKAVGDFNKVVEKAETVSSEFRADRQKEAITAMENMVGPGTWEKIGGAISNFFGTSDLGQIARDNKLTSNQELYMEARGDEKLQAQALDGIKEDLRLQGLTDPAEIDRVANLQAQVMDKAMQAGGNADRYLTTLRMWNKASDVDVNQARYSQGNV